MIVPIKKTRVAEEIADRIRTLILDGTFPPGRPLPGERLLAEQFGVSRGSIRDAGCQGGRERRRERSGRRVIAGRGGHGSM